MEYISANRYLNMDEMEVNARYISRRLLSHNWTLNAIAGVLGNMEVESTINPGIWEGLQEGNMSGGYGLVQWTPATKYTDWADSRGLPWGHPDSQIQRILYEVDNNIQWIHPTMTFKEFTISTLPPYILAVLFLHHYERPAEPDDDNRGKKGEFWYEFIKDMSPIEPVEPEEPRDKFYFSQNHRQFILRRRSR